MCESLNYDTLIVRDYVRHNVIMSIIMKRHSNVIINTHFIIIIEMLTS